MHGLLAAILRLETSFPSRFQAHRLEETHLCLTPSHLSHKTNCKTKRVYSMTSPHGRAGSATLASWSERPWAEGYLKIVQSMRFNRWRYFRISAASFACFESDAGPFLAAVPLAAIASVEPISAVRFKVCAIAVVVGGF